MMILPRLRRLGQHRKSGRSMRYEVLTAVDLQGDADSAATEVEKFGAGDQVLAKGSSMDVVDIEVPREISLAL